MFTETIETLEQGVKYVQWRRSDVFTVDFENVIIGQIGFKNLQ